MSNRSVSVPSACSAGPLALRSERGERDGGCGRRDEKVRLKHCSIGRGRERVPRGSYCIDLEKRRRREGDLQADVGLCVDGPFSTAWKKKGPRGVTWGLLERA